jgi:type VI protein secretion system component VasF
MTQNDRTEQLLEQILDVQRAQLEEYKRVTSQSLELQRRAVDAQTRYLRVLRPTIFVGAVVAAGLIVYVLWLSRYIR